MEKTRQQFNFSLNLNDSDDAEQFALIERLMAATGLNRAGIIRLIIAQSLPEFAKKHLGKAAISKTA